MRAAIAALSSSALLKPHTSFVPTLSQLPLPPHRHRSSSAAAGDNASPSPFMEKQFVEFRTQLEESGTVRERIRTVATELESASRIIHAGILLVHQSLPVSEVLDKARAQIEVIKGLFVRLAEIVGESPGQYYRSPGENKRARVELERAVQMFWDAGLPSPKSVAVDDVVEDDIVSTLRVSSFSEILFTKAGKILHRDRGIRGADEWSKMLMHVRV